MRAILITSILLSACAVPHQDSPLIPPHEFTKPGEPVAKLTFLDAGREKVHYMFGIYENAKDCSKVHFVNTKISRTVSVPIAKPLALFVGYSFDGGGKVNYCYKAATFFPDESEYKIRLVIQPLTGNCNLTISKQDAKGVIDNEKYIDRQWRQPFFDGWCKDTLPE
ncbi:hypothetical protein [Iodobacter fluviatilis]|uniref:Uncharacterized protein n=1 Tax=Iodobacter fluviatilis TaxID=537 RepID=A0A377Q622_9NEIS|nr:hypothetical protein [Iodobacter fluviatilis]TCU86940.1 hypothetical protein EV682_10565 [Iodobacter fluviatilis]STQ90272.1 Uncharacterised protein [Iodobacter fluviatilis]